MRGSSIPVRPAGAIVKEPTALRFVNKDLNTVFPDASQRPTDQEKGWMPPYGVFCLDNTAASRVTWPYPVAPYAVNRCDVEHPHSGWGEQAPGYSRVFAVNGSKIVKYGENAPYEMATERPVLARLAEVSFSNLRHGAMLGPSLVYNPDSAFDLFPGLPGFRLVGQPNLFTDHDGTTRTYAPVVQDFGTRFTAIAYENWSRGDLSPYPQHDYIHAYPIMDLNAIPGEYASYDPDVPNQLIYSGISTSPMKMKIHVRMTHTNRGSESGAPRDWHAGHPSTERKALIRCRLDARGLCFAEVAPGIIDDYIFAVKLGHHQNFFHAAKKGWRACDGVENAAPWGTGKDLRGGILSFGNYDITPVYAKIEMSGSTRLRSVVAFERIDNSQQTVAAHGQPPTPSS